MSVIKHAVTEPTELTSRSFVQGLSPAQVLLNRKKYGANTLKAKKLNPFILFIRQITGNPLIIILSIATTVSFFLDEKVSSIYIFWMILLSVGLGFWNEYSAEKTVQNLLKKISNTAYVLRDGKKVEIIATELVVDDVVFLGPGNIVPADMKVIDSKNLELNESVLTGESLPVLKQNNDNAFMGTVVLSGWAQGIIIEVGKKTEFGKIAEDVSFVKPETDFQKGLGKFGGLMVRVIAILTLGILALNILLGKGFITSLLFSLAIAVGLTPELLPVIVTISLSHGAGKLAKKHVIAKQLVSLENLGNMDVLCTDKTGTLTEGKINLVELISHKGTDSEYLLEYALLCNSAIVEHKIMGNPIDVAIWEYAKAHNFVFTEQFEKIAEKPFDYENNATYAVVKQIPNVRSDKKTHLVEAKPLFLVKGAPEEIISFCTKSAKNAERLEQFKDLCNNGYRVIALAKKSIEEKSSDKYSWKDAHDLEFVGFLSFMDVPKKSAMEALKKLQNLNVMVKILTGDNEVITQKIAIDVGLIEDDGNDVLLGSQIAKMSDTQLLDVIDEIDIFARVSPEQKLRIISLLKQKGHIVGYLGDGINDIPSLHMSDVGISVNTAVDVAKDASNVVILKKDLQVIAEGIIQGRRTFSNTIKYILMATSSNFGNMFSAAGASLLLPFLPMTPTQLLLNNSLYDFSQMVIPSDNVDAESLVRPRHWDIKLIKDYMLFIGPISSIYDFLTFGLMYFYFNARGALFQTGWFIESLATQVLVIFVIRTARVPFFKSRPSKWLFTTSVLVVLIGAVLPFSPLASSFGFVAPPLPYFVFLIIFVITYIMLAEFGKKLFLKKHTF